MRRSIFRNFRLGVEQLENRWCPAGTITVQGDTLVILGDDTANTVTVTHDGAGNVTAVIDAGTPVVASGIEVIKITTKGDADNVIFNVTGELTTELQVRLDLGSGQDTANLVFAAISNELHVKADLGSDNDVFNVNLDQELKTGADVHLDVRGQDGNDTASLSVNEVRTGAELHARFDGGADNDTYTVFMGDPIDAGAEVHIRGEGGKGTDNMTFDASTFGTGGNIGTDAQLKVDLGGGNDADTLTALYDGVVDGQLKIRLDGDGGNDNASATVTVNALSTGQADVRVNGGKHNDTLNLDLTDLSAGGAKVKGRIDGGKGVDTATFTGPVTVKKTEA